MTKAELQLIHKVLHQSRGTFIDPDKREAYYRDRDKALKLIEADIAKTK